MSPDEVSAVAKAIDDEADEQAWIEWSDVDDDNMQALARAAIEALDAVRGAIPASGGVPTSAEINALPPRWFNYIRAMLTDCDPANRIRSELELREQCEALGIMAATVTAERDALRADVERMRGRLEALRNAAEGTQQWLLVQMGDEAFNTGCIGRILQDALDAAKDGGG